jgi:hypothetical protein
MIQEKINKYIIFTGKPKKNKQLESEAQMRKTCLGIVDCKDKKYVLRIGSDGDIL